MEFATRSWKNMSNTIKTITIVRNVISFGSCVLFYSLTGQLADKPTRGQSSRGLVNSPTANF